MIRNLSSRIWLRATTITAGATLTFILVTECDRYMSRFDTAAISFVTLVVIFLASLPSWLIFSVLFTEVCSRSKSKTGGLLSVCGLGLVAAICSGSVIASLSGFEKDLTQLVLVMTSVGGGAFITSILTYHQQFDSFNQTNKIN